MHNINNINKQMLGLPAGCLILRQAVQWYTVSLNNNDKTDVGCLWCRMPDVYAGASRWPQGRPPGSAPSHVKCVPSPHSHQSQSYLKTTIQGLGWVQVQGSGSG